jgi:hypothetical protein
MLQSPAEISAMIVLIRNGRKEGFNLLYSKYAGALYGIICRICGDSKVAENLLEATFVCIVNRINEYAAETRLFTWLIQVAQCVCREHMINNGGKVDSMERIFLGGMGYDERAGQAKTSVAAVRADVRNKLKSLR